MSYVLRRITTFCRGSVPGAASRGHHERFTTFVRRVTDRPRAASVTHVPVGVDAPNSGVTVVDRAPVFGQTWEIYNPLPLQTLFFRWNVVYCLEVLWNRSFDLERSGAFRSFKILRTVRI